MGVIAVPGREVWRRQPQRVARPCLDKDWKARLWRGSVLAAYPFNYWQNAAIGPQRVDLNSQIEGTVSSAVAEWGIAQGTAGGGRAGRKYVGSPTLSNLTIAALVRFSSVSSLQVITGNDDANAQGVRIQCNGGSFQLTHLAQANVDLSASAFSANNAYFVAVSHDGTNDYWVVKNLTTGAISSGSVSDTFTPFSPTSGWCPVGYGRLTTESVDGQVGGVFISSAVLSVSELLSWAQNPHSIFFRRPARVFLPAAAGGSYSLACAAGSYALTGQPVAVLASRSLVAAQGSYTLTGQDVALRRLYALTAAQGAYNLSGQAVGLLLSRVLAAGQGSYALTGQAVNLLASRVLAAGQGSYAITGQAVGLVYTPLGAYSLLADAGSYTLTGQAVGLLLQRSLVAAQGSYSLTGQAVGLLVSRVLAAGQGSYALTGQAVGLIYTPAGASYTLTASAGSYALSGQAVNFSRNYVLSAAAGSYTLTGQAVTLSYSGAPPAEVYAAISALRRQMFGAQTSARPAQRATTRRPPQ